MTTTPEDYRSELIANKAAERAIENFARLLGVSSDASINSFRENMSWATQQRGRSSEAEDNIRWVTEQRRRGTLMADTARKATIEKLMTGVSVIITAAASAALIVFLASKGIHV